MWAGQSNFIARVGVWGLLPLILLVVIQGAIQGNGQLAAPEFMLLNMVAILGLPGVIVGRDTLLHRGWMPVSVDALSWLDLADQSLDVQMALLHRIEVQGWLTWRELWTFLDHRPMILSGRGGTYWRCYDRVAGRTNWKRTFSIQAHALNQKAAILQQAVAPLPLPMNGTQRSPRARA
jgi:hypothetical protein